MSDERNTRKVRQLWLLATFLVFAGCAGIFWWHEEISQSRSATKGWVLITGVSMLIWPILFVNLAMDRWRRRRRR